MYSQIDKNAKLVIEQFQAVTNFDFGYNAESIEWIDGFLTKQRERDDFTQGLHAGLVNTIGSFLGECIIASYGGSWEQSEEGWIVSFDEKNKVFPFGKVYKHLENGLEDSIYSFYTIIPIVFKDSVGGHWFS